MKFKGSYLIAISTAIILTGCASYNASPLSSLESDLIITQAQNSSDGEVLIGAKAFNKADCKKYLDRDVISEGYQPVQLFILNNSAHDYSFSLGRISLSCARAEEVAEKVHTSTAGRATGYGVASLFLWPLAIPAVIDGVKSSNANEALDNDFSAKVARDQMIFRHSHYNRILFVPVNEYQSSFKVTLMDQESNEPKTINVSASS